MRLLWFFGVVAFAIMMVYWTVLVLRRFWPARLIRFAFLPFGEKRIRHADVRPSASSSQEHLGGYRQAALVDIRGDDLDLPDKLNTEECEGRLDSTTRSYWLRPSLRVSMGFVRIDVCVEEATIVLEALFLPVTHVGYLAFFVWSIGISLWAWVFEEMPTFASALGFGFTGLMAVIFWRQLRQSDEEMKREATRAMDAIEEHLTRGKDQ